MENLTKEQKEEQAKIAADAKAAQAAADKAAKAEQAAADKAAKDAAAGDNKIAKQMDAMQKSMESMQDLIKAQAKALAELKGGKEEKKEELPKIPKDTVKSAKKEFKWAVPHFRFKEKYFTADDASIDQKLIDEIVAIEGQGILVEVH